jgi:hypothetical protein
MYIIVHRWQEKKSMSARANRWPGAMTKSQHVYEVRPRSVDYAKFCSRSHDAVIRVYDEAGNVIEMHEQAGDFHA